MTDATILIPTFDHAAFLPYAIRSALAQEGAEIDVFVVGDRVARVRANRPRRASLLAVSRARSVDKVVLTRAAHTLAAYRRLSYGWNTAPRDVWTDLHMLRKFLELPGLRARSGSRATAFHFPDQLRRRMSTTERAHELDSWWSDMHSEGFRERLHTAASEEILRTAVRSELRIQELKAALSVST